MSRNPRLYLEDMVKSCEKILRYTNGMIFDEFISDELTTQIENLLVQEFDEE